MVLICEDDNVERIARNNLIWAPDDDYPSGGIFVSVGAPTVDGVTARLYANSIRVSGIAGTSNAAVLWDVKSGATNTSLHSRNNIISSDFFADDPVKAFKLNDASGVASVDFDYDVSCDGSADDNGGANHLIGVDEDDIWANADSLTKPFAPKLGGEITPAEGDNLYSSGVTVDALGRARPDAAQYRGAVRYVPFVSAAAPAPSTGSAVRRRRMA